VLPVTVFLVIMLLYMNTRSLAKTFIILLAVPFSAVGAVWLLYLLGYNMSIGVWVGLIALMGVDAETGSSCCCISTSRMRTPVARDGCDPAVTFATPSCTAR
jgi:Cu/Ag efflux pump CusA